MTRDATPPIQSVLQITALDPEARADPYPRLAALQAQCPVFRDEIAGVTLFTRYADVKAIANDRTMWRHPSNAEETSMSRRILERVPGDATGSEERAESILFLDDPDHARIRQPLTQAFYARVAKMKTGIEAVVAEVFDKLGEPKRFDLMAELAIPIPILAIARILGVEEHRLAEFRVWSEGIILGLAPMRTEAQNAELLRASQGAGAYFTEAMADRRAQPRDDLISDLVKLQAEGWQVSDAELRVNMISLLVGGNLTTTDLIGNGVRHFLENPGELAKFRADPGLANAAVEEVLRYDPPVDNTARVASRDQEIGACPVKQRHSLMISLRAANRDPALFPEPDRFDITRKGNPHVAFGGGAHICIGAPLARIEAAAAFREIFRRFPNLRLAEQDYVYRALPFFRGLEALWVET